MKKDLFMFAGANIQYVLQDGVLPDVIIPLGILMKNAHTNRVFPSQNLTTTTSLHKSSTMFI